MKALNNWLWVKACLFSTSRFLTHRHPSFWKPHEHGQTHQAPQTSSHFFPPSPLEDRFLKDLSGVTHASSVKRKPSVRPGRASFKERMGLQRRPWQKKSEENQCNFFHQFLSYLKINLYQQVHFYKFLGLVISTI